jgi:CRISPR-associated protein Cmr6
MAKGILKISKTNKGKIFVELDKLNGKPPMPLSYVVFPDTSLNGTACEYEMDAKGILMSIKVVGNVVWSRTPAPTAHAVQGQNTTLLTGASKFQDSLSIPDTFLPKDVRKIGFTDIDNFALKLQKAARYEVNQSKDNYKFTFYKNDQREKVFFEIKANYGHLNDHFDTLCKRQAQQVEQLFPNNCRKILLQPQWRFILGLGGESVYETNMTLHPNYGIPYLPSSSIKGVLRSWMISQIFAALENVPDEEQDFPLVNAEFRAITTSKLFCTIFGCPKEIKKVIFKNKEPFKNKQGDPVYDNDAAHLNFNVFKKEEQYQVIGASGMLETRTRIVSKAYQGIITFFDGLPTVAPIIKTDVMNVHYKDWYKDIGYQAPTDTQKTNPIHFLTISNENHLQFQTYLSIIKKNVTLKDIGNDYSLFIKDSNLSADSKLLDLVQYWLEKALLEHGIGAKTAVGYGYMKS